MGRHMFALLISIPGAACSFTSLEPLLCPKERPTCEGEGLDGSGADAAPDAPEAPDGAAAHEAGEPAPGEGGGCDACQDGGTPELQLLHASGSGGGRIRFSFAVRNLSPRAFDLSALTVRYFFTTETGQDPVFECSSVIGSGFSCDDLTWARSRAMAA
jgi:hypothetical protein